MERNLNHDEFDQFLKEAADGLRLRPSDKIWKNISRELDRRKWRFVTIFALTLLFVSGVYVSWEIAEINSHRAFARIGAIVLPPIDQANTPTQNNIGPIATKPHTATTALLQLQKNTPAATAKKEAAPGKNISLKTIPAAGLLPTQIIAAAIPEEAPYTTSSAAPIARLNADKHTPQLSNNIETANRGTSFSSEPVTTATIKRNGRKLSWQIFATPTVSYRILSDNKAYARPILTTGIPANFSALYGINDAVIHKPDLGIEFGVAARYPLGRNVNLRTGFQFNVSRYDIKAFSYVPEVATIALNNGLRVDSVRAISNYRNFAGGSTNWLQNFYFQASLPVGLELKVAGNKKRHWGLATSLQPTYIIGNRSYMITADYKNYARVPWLTRRWNVNTSLETFVALHSGKTKWQIGPQVRYQALSSFIREYPVKENLFDFGMKVGITLK